MYYVLVKLMFALFLINEAYCRADNRESQIDLNGHLKSLDAYSNYELLKRKYLRMRPILDKLFNLNDESLLEFNGKENDDSSSLSNSNESNEKYISLDDYQKEKRAFMASHERSDRFMKGKRVNKNMFASGLQGVWGVPGKR